jgi:hypothetical protein
VSDQSFQSHAHRPTQTLIAAIFAMVAFVAIVRQIIRAGADNRDLALLFTVLSVFTLIWISRVYIVRLQDRIIMLEVKVRAAELLTSGQDAQLAKLNSKQIAALRFAGDAEFGALLDRAARENLAPKEIKASIKNWRPDLYRT